MFNYALLDQRLNSEVGLSATYEQGSLYVSIEYANRYSLRRESAGPKAEKPGPAEDNFEVDEIKYDVSHLQENLAIENEPTSLGSKVHEEAKEGTPCNCIQLISVLFSHVINLLCELFACSLRTH